jgi:hypothetical protein
MRIAYLTAQEAELGLSRECTINLFLIVIQDDITGEYYSTEESISYITDPEMIDFKFKPLVDLPQHEYYKFKLI